MEMEHRDVPADHDYYVIRVKNRLDGCWADWFAGLTMTYTQDGDTILSGPLADQAALHGLLARIRDLNLTLISVQRMADPAAPDGCGDQVRKHV